MPRTLYEDWVKGPHDPKDRSVRLHAAGRLPPESACWSRRVCLNDSLGVLLDGSFVQWSGLVWSDAGGLQYVGQFFSWLIETRAWEYLFLAFITFNATIKFTNLRDTPEEWKETLLDISFYAVLVYTIEWFIELFTLGTQEGRVKTKPRPYSAYEERGESTKRGRTDPLTQNHRTFSTTSGT